MWTKLKTRIANFFGFWTMAQIAGQYESPQKKFWDNYLAEKNQLTKAYVDKQYHTGGVVRRGPDTDWQVVGYTTGDAVVNLKDGSPYDFPIPTGHNISINFDATGDPDSIRDAVREAFNKHERDVY